MNERVEALRQMAGQGEGAGPARGEALAGGKALGASACCPRGGQFYFMDVYLQIVSMPALTVSPGR